METISPMLAVRGEPFDSDEHLFEVKWDGIRALCGVDARGVKLWGRNRADYTSLYPELESLRDWPAGTVLDGEIVILRDGRANLEAVLQRHHSRDPLRLRHAAKREPVTYVLFDVLRDGDRPLVDAPFSERRGLLNQLLQRFPDPRLGLSEGVIGPGREFFEQTVAAGHEGVMAKLLRSRYTADKRSSSWRKIKPARCVPCVVIGYTAKRGRLRSLLVAAQREAELQYAAELTAGWTAPQQDDLYERLARKTRRAPVVACPKRARWVQPELYCRVNFLQWTPGGRMRGASFAGLIEETA